MFTGIIMQTAAIDGRKQSGDNLTLSFKKPKGWTDLELGESIATDGACLTVSAIRDDTYDCELMPETLAKTSFGTQVPPKVNLERAMAAGDRLGGHFVQGHVDEVGRVTAIKNDSGYEMSIGFSPENRPLVIPKGSITINGVSLTVAQAAKSTLTVALIPYTLEYTTLGALQVGDPVNLEFDMIGKYIVGSLAERQ